MSPAPADAAADRALAAWGALRSLFRTSRWRGPSLRDGPWTAAGMASVWALGQAMAAALDLRLLGLVGDDEIERWLALLHRYADGDGYGAFPGERPRYYDDNAWVGLDLVQQHLTTGDDHTLDRAHDVLRMLLEGEHPDGGVYWVEHPRQSRHTCSTAPAGELAARLHQLRGDDETLRFARRCADFLASRLLRDDGLFADNLRDDGSSDDAVYSYNQGTPVGLFVLLHEIRRDAGGAGGPGPDELDLARTAVDASVAHYAADGAERLWTGSPAFNAIWFRNLLLYDAAVPTPAIRSLLAAYTDRLWRHARDDRCFFTRGGIGRYERGGVLDQAGVVQLFAMQAVPPDRVHHLC